MFSLEEGKSSGKSFFDSKDVIHSTKISHWNLQNIFVKWNSKSGWFQGKKTCQIGKQVMQLPSFTEHSHPRANTRADCLAKMQCQMEKNMPGIFTEISRDKLTVSSWPFQKFQLCIYLEFQEILVEWIRILPWMFSKLLFSAPQLEKDPGIKGARWRIGDQGSEISDWRS